MNYAALMKSTFDSVAETPIHAWEDFAERCEVVSFNKNDTIKSANKIERYFSFILKGSIGVFLWKKNQWVCLDFAFDNHFFSDYFSILLKQPSPLQIIALENSEILRLSADEYDRLTSEPDGKMIRLHATEMSYIQKQQQQIELLTKSASERYQLLLARFPDIHNRITQNHIASYLGITPQSLSRIRKT